MKNHYMIDLETLSTRLNASILSMGVVRFDPFDMNIPMDELYLKIDIDSCQHLNLDISDSTINWWAKQSIEAQEEAFSSADRINIVTAFEKLYDFTWGAKYVWSNGAAFDIPICENVFIELNKKIPWGYYDIRDVRTMFDLGIDPQLPEVTAHNALQDAIAQAKGIQVVTLELLKRGITPFLKK